MHCPPFLLLGGIWVGIVTGHNSLFSYLKLMLKLKLEFIKLGLKISGIVN